MTGNHSKQDQMCSVKIGKYIGFWVYRRSYLLWSPVIVPKHRGIFFSRATSSWTHWYIYTCIFHAWRQWVLQQFTFSAVWMVWLEQELQIVRWQTEQPQFKKSVKHSVKIKGLLSLKVLLVPRSCLGDKPLKFQVFRVLPPERDCGTKGDKGRLETPHHARYNFPKPVQIYREALLVAFSPKTWDSVCIVCIL